MTNATYYYFVFVFVFVFVLARRAACAGARSASGPTSHAPERVNAPKGFSATGPVQCVPMLGPTLFLLAVTTAPTTVPTAPPAAVTTRPVAVVRAPTSAPTTTAAFAVPSAPPTSQPVVSGQQPVQVTVVLPPTEPKTDAGMSDGLKIALTALLAIVTFVVGQIIQRIFIEPIQEQRKVIGRIANALTIYQNAWLHRDAHRDNEESRTKLEAASAALHGLAADLRSSVTTLPLHRLLAFFRLVVDRDTAWQVADKLLRWGALNSKEDAIGNRQNIMSLLKIDFGNVPSEIGESASKKDV